MSDVEHIGIEVNFLTDRYVATSSNDRRKDEWPPHPARLFSALVDAWADADEPSPRERLVLEWLEAQRSPMIAASSATHRQAVSHFVPVNDAAILSRARQVKKAGAVCALEDRLTQELTSSAGEITRVVSQIRKKLCRQREVEVLVSKTGNTNPSAALQMLPEQRKKQERFFPSVTPDTPRVTYLWSCAVPAGVRHDLDGLLQRVTRLGHSSSLVSCRVSESNPEATYLPGNGSGESLRWVRKGQLAELERRFSRHGGFKPRALPYTEVRYAVAKIATQNVLAVKPSTAGEWLIFECEHQSRFLPSTRTVALTTAMRTAILRHAPDPVPETLSGYGLDGSPTNMPHVAFLALPYVGTEHADGRLLGIALAVPDSVGDADRRALYRAVGTWEMSASGESSHLELPLANTDVSVLVSRLRGPASLNSLQQHVWNTSTRYWISATPIALPRHPGRLSGNAGAARTKAWKSAESALTQACAHVGLPEPEISILSLSPMLRGSRHIRDFPAFSQRGGNDRSTRRQLVHAALSFEKPLSGPLVLGTGRFLGLGLMRPLMDPPDVRGGNPHA